METTINLTAQGVAATAKAAPASAAVRLASAAFRAIFSARASMAVATLLLLAIYWHLLTIAEPLAQQAAMGTDLLLALPWALVWATRTTIAELRTLKQEGGEA